jgi:hypothetical protein
MANVRSDNQQVESILRKINTQVESAGGFIHPNIDLVYKAGNFSIQKNGEIEDRHFIKIPHQILAPYSSFDFEIEGRDIILAPYDSNLSSPQYELFSNVLDLYNESGRFHAHCKASPWLNYKQDPDIVKLLLKARHGEDLTLIKKMLGHDEYDEELALFTFFKARMAYCRLNNRHQPPTEVYLPLIEFLNHHPAGAGYDNLYNKKTEQGFMAVAPVTPIENSGECFTCYGALDALDSYLHYGFVDNNASFVRSIPLSIEIAEIGTITIGAQNRIVPVGDRAEHLKDLGPYLPHIKYVQGSRQIDISHLIIPGERAFMSLKRVLHEILVILEPKIDKKSAATYVDEIDIMVARKNLEYYSLLADCILGANAGDERPPSEFYENINSVTTRQLKVIEAYKSRHQEPHFYDPKV